MDTLNKTLQYLADPANNFWGVVAVHLEMSGLSLLIALLIGVPLGILVSRYVSLGRPVVNVMGILRVIPSLAVLFLLLPSQGIGFRPSVIALTLLAIPPLLINTNAGMRAVDPAILEAARGMGMSYRRLLRLISSSYRPWSSCLQMRLRLSMATRVRGLVPVT